MRQLAQLCAQMGFEEKTVAAVVGCGGKTTFIERAAHVFRHRKVLVAPTTKMWPMAGGAVLCGTRAACEGHRPRPGVQCLGVTNPATGKLEALPPAVLAGLVPGYDLALLEADGSAGLPCKGWLENEPVVPPYATHTVGVVTLEGLGKPAGAQHVLRLPQFLALTGLTAGDTITPAALAAMVCAPQGMFRGSAGVRCLLVNKVEDTQAAQAAAAWLETVRRQRPGFFSLLAWGSVQQNKWTVV